MAKVQSINRQNLRVARENLGLDSVTASKKVTKTGKDIVADWENGGALPSWSQVEKLAKIYGVSSLLFFSDQPLPRSKVIPDYRASAGAASNEKIKNLIGLVLSRQKWIEEISKKEKASKNRIQGSGKELRTPRELASFISTKLEIDLDMIKGIAGVDARKKVLNYLIQKVEAHGVFVGKTVAHQPIPVEDLRGIFISNEFCPFIVLNRRDAVSAQIFSLAHELAHLFRKTDAISNSLDFRRREARVDPEEVFCNRVAAELLLPAKDFNRASYDKADISDLSLSYKVSEIFIFYRLQELGKVDSRSSASLEREIKEEMARNLLNKAIQEKRKKGGSYTNSMKDSNGTLLNRLVSRLYLDNEVGYVEASKVLRLSVERV